MDAYYTALTKPVQVPAPSEPASETTATHVKVKKERKFKPKTKLLNRGSSVAKDQGPSQELLLALQATSQQLLVDVAALAQIVQNNEKLAQARHDGDLLKYRDQLFSTLQVLAVNQTKQ